MNLKFQDRAPSSISKTKRYIKEKYIFRTLAIKIKLSEERERVNLTYSSPAATPKMNNLEGRKPKQILKHVPIRTHSSCNSLPPSILHVPSHSTCPSLHLLKFKPPPPPSPPSSHCNSLTNLILSFLCFPINLAIHIK